MLMRKEQLKVALIQMNCEKGEIQHNVQRSIEFSPQTSEAGADIVCFPKGIDRVYRPSQIP